MTAGGWTTDLGGRLSEDEKQITVDAKKYICMVEALARYQELSEVAIQRLKAMIHINNWELTGDLAQQELRMAKELVEANR